MQTRTYSYFPNSLFGVPGQGRTGAVSVSLANNLEMKVKSDNDSIGEKKISLIENFTISQSYNFAADSMRFSNLNTSLMLRLVKNFNLNLSATWDVYTYALNASGAPVRVNKLRISQGKGWGKLSSTGTSFSYTFNNDTFKKLFGKNKDEKNDKDSKNNKDNQNNDNSMNQNFAEDTSDYQGNTRKSKKNNSGMEFDDDGYMKWSVPWNMTFNYYVN